MDLNPDHLKKSVLNGLGHFSFTLFLDIFWAFGLSIKIFTLLKFVLKNLIFVFFLIYKENIETKNV